MFNSEELLSEYNDLSTIIKELAEIGFEELVGIETKFNSFGEKLNAFIISSIEAVSNEKEEKEKLLKKVEQLIPKADFDYHTKLISKEYEQYWGILESKAKTYLVTASYMLNMLKMSGSDFSPIVLEFAKVIETELNEKIFFSFIVEQSKEPFKTNCNSMLFKSIERYYYNNEYFFPFKAMFITLITPTLYSDYYYTLLHKRLANDNWDMGILTDEIFIKSGIEYVEKYRNTAAHCETFSEGVAETCKKKTKRIIDTLFSAYYKAE